MKYPTFDLCIYQVSSKHVYQFLSRYNRLGSDSHTRARTHIYIDTFTHTGLHTCTRTDEVGQLYLQGSIQWTKVQFNNSVSDLLNQNANFVN